MAKNKSSERTTYRERIKIAFEQSDETSFEEFLINKMELDHNKSVKMAGDLGIAYSKIGDLELEFEKFSKKSSEAEKWKAEMKFLWPKFKRANGNVSKNQRSVERFVSLLEED